MSCGVWKKGGCHIALLERGARRFTRVFGMDVRGKATQAELGPYANGALCSWFPAP